MGKNAEAAGVSADIAAEGLRSTQRVVAQGRHVETVAHDGRSMLKMKGLNPGKPEVVSDGVNSTVKKLVNEKGYTNLDLMKEGYAPIGSDGRQVNLHHVFAYEPGPVIEMEATAHTKQFKKFHKMIKESFRQNSSLANDFDGFREDWWLSRSKDFVE
ncbi:MAG TPA: HNH/ENDO VII family nuclease [Oligoflexus sp.]|uniref:HNH/ENDO VII family nuclease n=1 Tax=Oligoflexus sp. TaxID=1971216 RepID=UPI002D4419AC|nr:HNH/ENDO VII family nuclease [Oligoflexus sp.]HYX39694.1 HNH/ENDO VII family nuclease [Oligoflexus sp.]